MVSEYHYAVSEISHPPLPGRSGIALLQVHATDWLRDHTTALFHRQSHLSWPLFRARLRDQSGLRICISSLYASDSAQGRAVSCTLFVDHMSFGVGPAD